MAQIGSDEKPFMLHPKGAVSKESRFRKGFNKTKYDQNYENIFGHKTELDIAREKSKTFSMSQD